MLKEPAPHDYHEDRSSQPSHIQDGRGAHTIRVLIRELDLLTNTLDATGSVPSAHLTVEGLTSVASRPLSKRTESLVDAVRDAFSMGPAGVTVRVFMNIGSDIGLGTIRVGDCVEISSRSSRDESSGACPAVSRK